MVRGFCKHLNSLICNLQERHVATKKAHRVHDIVVCCLKPQQLYI